MKIRSHTGNYVEARPKMRALWKTDAHKDTSGTLEYEAEVESIDGEHLYLKGIGRVPAGECTMTFCPFAAGDEVEFPKASGGYDERSPYTLSDKNDVIAATYDGARHASPDLRPAEGYGV